MQISTDIIDAVSRITFESEFKELLKDITKGKRVGDSYNLSPEQYFKLVSKLFDTGPANQPLKDLAKVVGIDLLVAMGHLKLKKNGVVTQGDFDKMLPAVNGARFLYSQEHQYLKTTLNDILQLFANIEKQGNLSPRLNQYYKSIKKLHTEFLSIPASYSQFPTFSAFLKQRDLLHSHFGVVVTTCESLKGGVIGSSIDMEGMRKKHQEFSQEQKKYEGLFVVKAQANEKKLVSEAEHAENQGDLPKQQQSEEEKANVLKELHKQFLGLGVSFSSIPEKFLCAKTQQLMTDPVIAADGHTYERDFIERWVEPHGGAQIPSPVEEGEPLRHFLVKPNEKLREEMCAYFQAAIANAKFEKHSPPTASAASIIASNKTSVMNAGPKEEHGTDKQEEMPEALQNRKGLGPS